MRNKQWDQISDEARDLCLQMMVHEPENRLTAEEALSHPWIKVILLNIAYGFDKVHNCHNRISLLDSFLISNPTLNSIFPLSRSFFAYFSFFLLFSLSYFFLILSFPLSCLFSHFHYLPFFLFSHFRYPAFSRISIILHFSFFLFHYPTYLFYPFCFSHFLFPTFLSMFINCEFSFICYNVHLFVSSFILSSCLS